MISLRNILLVESAIADNDFVTYIKDQEGSKKQNGLHIAYKDTSGVWTIGYGHTGVDVKPKLTWTEPKAEAQLIKDIASAESQLVRYIASKFPNKELDANQKKILLDFIFNGGLGILNKFPKFTNAVVNKNWNVAAQEYKRYDANGNELKKRNADFFKKFIQPNLNDSTTFQSSNIMILPPIADPSQQITIKVNKRILPLASMQLQIYSSTGQLVRTHNWQAVTRGILEFPAPKDAGTYILRLNDTLSTKLQVR
jgi:GH24 family phage-related lysozyme (muramidase)